MEIKEYQIQKIDVSDLYKNIFEITPAFKKNLVLPKKPNLAVGLCNIGFNIISPDLDFSYRNPNEVKLQNMKDMYNIRNFDSFNISSAIKEYGYLLMPNSRLTILSKPGLTIRTNYQPNHSKSNKSKLTILSILRDDKVEPIINFGDINEKLAEMTPEWIRTKNLAQEVADRALEDLCINQVYIEYQEAREIARETKDPVERTLRLYLGK